MVAVALLGATIGFSPFNRPVARLFLGDVGSLPIGLLISWLMLMLAGRDNLAAAILLPLYYLSDATLTLGRRMIAREPVWQAHRTHFYQRATDRGLTVDGVVARVLVANVALAALALLSVVVPGATSSFLSLAAGVAIVGTLLASLARRRR